MIGAVDGSHEGVLGLGAAHLGGRREFPRINVVFRCATSVLPGGSQIDLHRVAATSFYKILPPAVVISVFAGVGILIAEDGLGAGTRSLLVVGLVTALLSGVTTIVINIPINRMVEAWGGGSPPPEQAEINRRWAFGNVVRTVLALTALPCFILAALIR
jgi:hypothetical protein